DRAVDRFADREILGERAGERRDARVAPVLPRLDRQDLDLQDTAGLGIRDRDRAGQDMGAELRGQRRDARAMIGQELETRAGRWCKRFRQLARITAFSESSCRNGRNRRLLRLKIARVDSTPCKGLGSSGKIPLSVRHGNSSDTIVRQSAIGKPAPLGEAALYLPVKRFFEKSGFDVKGEVNGCDLVAYRGDEPPVIVELKLRFTLALVL